MYGNAIHSILIVTFCKCKTLKIFWVVNGIILVWYVAVCNALQTGRSRVWFPMVSLELFTDIILPAALWPWRSIQPLREMSTRNISFGRKAACVGLTTLPPSCADRHEIWETQTPGNLRACPGLQWDCFNFFYVLAYHKT